MRGLHISLAVRACTNLISVLQIFSKGVANIVHGGLHGYYLCLSKLGREKLLAMLPDLEGKSNDLYMSRLKGVVEGVQPLAIADGGADEEDGPSFEAAEAAWGSPSAPLVDASVRWRRCWVDLGSGHSY